LDLATESWAVDSVLLISGDGKGNFSGQKFYKVGKRPYQRLRAADVNKDGRVDIVTTNLEGNNATVLLSMGEGKFQEAQNSPFPAGMLAWFPADTDLSIPNESDQQMKLMILEFKDTPPKVD